MCVRLIFLKNVHRQKTTLTIHLVDLKQTDRLSKCGGKVHTKQCLWTLCHYCLLSVNVYSAQRHLLHSSVLSGSKIPIIGQSNTTLLSLGFFSFVLQCAIK